MQCAFTSNQQPEVLQSIFLGRLQRLLKLEETTAADLPERLLICRALTSIYWDLCRLGARRDARVLMNLRDH
jgi:hypothetical protein